MKLVIDARDFDEERPLQSVRRIWSDRFGEPMPRQWELTAMVQQVHGWWVLHFTWRKGRK